MGSTLAQIPKHTTLWLSFLGLYCTLALYIGTTAPASNPATYIDFVLRIRSRAFFDEALGRAKLRAVEEAERRRKGRDKFASFLRHARGLREDTEWESFAAQNEKEPEMRMVSSDRACLVASGRWYDQCWVLEFWLAPPMVVEGFARLL